MARIKIVIDELDAEICHLYSKFGRNGFLHLASPRVESLRDLFGRDVENEVITRAPESLWVEVRAEVEREVECA